MVSPRIRPTSGIKIEANIRPSIAPLDHASPLFGEGGGTTWPALTVGGNGVLRLKDWPGITSLQSNTVLHTEQLRLQFGFVDAAVSASSPFVSCSFLPQLGQLKYTGEDLSASLITRR